MLLRSYRRPGRRSRLRLLATILVFVALIDLTLILRSISVARRHEPPDEQRPRAQRVYIASMHWMTGNLLQSHWNAALLNLVQHLGADNVYVSVLEGGSWDSTRDMLLELDAQLGQLGVPRHMRFEDTSHEDEVTRAPEPGESGWIWTSRGQERRRIPYLASLRNKAMEPFYELARNNQRFDKVLWLNDVIFTSDSVDTLLATRGGEYAAACAMDYAKPPRYYDSFAMRDREGHAAITNTWPYFLAADSLAAMERSEPVPVSSCWNGIVVFQAQPFYEATLHFRGISDSLATHHLEGSECCLIHADNPLSAKLGVWLNPNVRVAYNVEAWNVVNSGAWPGVPAKVWGMWKNRWTRWIGMMGRYSEQSTVNQRLKAWTKDENYEPGRFCLVNEMQVLRWNGWAHL